MRSMPSRLRLLAILSLPLLSMACAGRSTPPSLGRGERPTLPKLSPEYVQTERPAALTAKPTGQLMTIDRGIFQEMMDRLAELVGMVERANIRAGGVKRERACVAAIFATGKAPANCGR